MKEVPILMSPPMVRAIIEGTKTQTRRIVKFPSNVNVPIVERWAEAPYGGHGKKDQFTPLNHCGGIATKAFHDHSIPCPYGKTGDRFWVRETFYIDDARFIGKRLPKEMAIDLDDRDIYYPADAVRTPKRWCCELIPECCCSEVGKPKARPSIFMPRWASRLSLEIKSVCVERLTAISEWDAYAEGISRSKSESPNPRASFRTLWDSINGIGSFNMNPWVWVIKFRKLQGRTFTKEGS